MAFYEAIKDEMRHTIIRHTVSKYLIAVLILLLISSALVFWIRPPGKAIQSGYHYSRQYLEPYLVKAGKLPGITWADDIHPIFVRNKCGICHTRGKEDSVEGLKEFSLGLVDPNDPLNAQFSYRELVYTEGLPRISKGETLRDGQCCWPKGFPVDQQRRIWIRHPERSALMRKLERNYYDWNKQPRFLEEGLRLHWGLPMPWYMGNGASFVHREMGHGTKSIGEHIKKPEGHHNKKAGNGYSVRSIFSRILFRTSLWMGFNKDKLHGLPPRIPRKDRALIRYWISHALQLRQDGTSITINVVNSQGRAMQGVRVRFIGNFATEKKRQVKDSFNVRTGPEGSATLSFPRWSVITAFWFVSAESRDKKTKYMFVRVSPGQDTGIQLVLE